MKKHTALLWSIEFASVTAIAIILSTAAVPTKWWVALPACAILATKVVDYIRNDHVAISIIRYQVQILLTLLPAGGSKIRCTYHRPRYRILRFRKVLIQAFDYVPSGGGGGRPFPIEKGIIGKAFSNKSPRVENFASDEEYRNRMVMEYNYTVTELMQRTADRRSYLCYPIVDEDHRILGLLYLDSDTPNTFLMDEANPRWRAVCDAGDVIRGNILGNP